MQRIADGNRIERFIRETERVGVTLNVGETLSIEY
jgi:hypothetical protein